MSRSADILKAAAAALEEGTDPFCTSFLDANRVTFDECMDMADSLAIGARLIAWAMENPKQAAAAASGAGTGLHYHAVTEALARFNAKT